ncbi:MAG TPA: cytochrome C [Thiotrichaceae bacterium]|nr:cytochrome C [Thiotrichaceae bacterium]
MKKIVTTLVLTGMLLSAGSYSYSKGYTKQDRIEDMHTMAQAMIDIQTGFLFNNFVMVQEGVHNLSTAVENVKPPLEETEEKNPMTRYMNNKVRLTNQMVKKINKKALTILERFRDNDATQAVQAYTKILKVCIECHIQIRHW